MKESAWRSKLIAMRKKTNPTDFIWAMDAKFKSGFPDIYLLTGGVPYHIELKIDKFYQEHNGLDPIQLHVLRQLNKSGAKAYCLNLQDNGSIGISEICTEDSYSRLCYSHNFLSEWSKEQPFI